MKKVIVFLLCIICFTFSLTAIAADPQEIAVEPEEIIEEPEYEVLAAAASTVASGSCGTNVTWTLDSNGLLSIGGSGAMRNYTQVSGQGAPWYSRASSVKKIVISYGVTSIGDVAFNNCINLTHVTIPSSVTYIGMLAFQNCTSLTSVQIPSSVSSIGIAPFRDCSGLMEISVTTSNSYYVSFGGVLFNKSFSELIQFPGGRTGAYNVPYGVETIPNSAFLGCSLSSISLPATVTNIDTSAFQNSDSLTQVTLSSNLQKLMDFAFYSCDLKEIVIPASLLTVEDAAFEYNEKLSDIALLNPDLNVNVYAFSDTANKNVSVYFAGTEEYYSEMRVATGLCTTNSYSNNTVLVSPVTGTCGDNLTWYYFSDGTLYLDGTGDMYDYAYGTAPWHNFPVNKVVLPNGLTSIGASAFAGQGFDTISLPSSIACVGIGAFEGCNLLGQIIFDGPEELWNTVLNSDDMPNIPVVFDCADGHIFSYGVCTQCGNHGGQCGSDLQWVLVNNALVISGHGDMYGYSNGAAPWSAFRQKIEKLALSDNITSIGTSAFWGLDAITEVTVPASVTSIGRLAFCRCFALREVELPNNLSTVGDYAFSSCTALKKINMPDSVTTIGTNAFQECTTLSEIRWSKNLTAIGDYAFSSCSSLTSIVIPDSVHTIGAKAFLGCKNAVLISLPDQLSSLGDYAFSNCKQLTTIAIPNGVTELLAGLFSGCTKLSKVEFSDNVTAIGAYCFSECTSLTTILWPSALKTLGNYSFDGCTKLTDVTIPDGVTVIPQGCFYDCTSMLEIVLPAGLTKIEDFAFYYSSNPAYMKYIFFKGTKEQWNGISIGGYNYRLTVSARKHYETSDHVREIKEAVPPTCISTGLTEGLYCPFCSLVFVAQKTVPAAGHTSAPDEAKAPTCTETGLTEGSHCKTCGVVITAQEIIPESGHSEADAVEENYEASTCTKNGSYDKVVYCSVCETELDRETVSLPVADHTPVTDPAVASTCTKTGFTEGSHCGVCTAVLVAQNVVPVADHTPVIDPAVESTCTKTGLTEGSHCGVCSEVLVAQTETRKKNHTIVIDEPVKPTCTESGLSGTGMHCSVCGTVLHAQTVVPALGHSYEDAAFAWNDDLSSVTVTVKCHCSHETEEEAELKWEQKADGTLTVTASVTVGEQTFTDTKEISVSKNGDAVTIVLPGEIPGLIVYAAVYDADGRLTGVQKGSVDANTITLQLSGGNVRIFMLTSAFVPVCPTVEF